MLSDPDNGVRAILGPTNTGKTHYAIERMLGHRTGMIGLPLRLLAREVYDRIVKLKGPSVVALVTGEERIVPERAAYWVCTVEAMPERLAPEFLAVDEIQLCADPERGHVFTDRLLHWRGTQETLFLGARTMQARIAELISRSEFRRRERYSTLSYSGSKKISRLPARSAIVGFSIDDVYAIAEVLRRLKGGAAVVMGALSPRTRNAQVELYQNGDVDYLVATDAIGMGLNLDISHVAFAGTVKFDGRRVRSLLPHEMGQIAGRAGRFRTDGTFGVTGEVSPLDPDLAKAIEEHRFQPIAKLHWRNRKLQFGSIEALLASLAEPPDQPSLVKGREADDEQVLRLLETQPNIRDKVRNSGDVKRLWSVCQVPDFRKVGRPDHAALLSTIFDYLCGKGQRIPADWLAGQVARIDNVKGDIDTLSKRLAYIRTWTYVSQKSEWLDDAEYWRDETRRVEDRLSDAMHAALTQRFVDRRTSVLMRRLKQRESLVAEVAKEGAVSVDGEFVGQLDGFRFRLDPKASGTEAKTLRQAAAAALAPEYALRAERMYNAPDAEFDLTEQGGLMWGDAALGKLTRGADVLSPGIEVFVDDEAGADVAAKVERRLSHWMDRRIQALFEPLLTMKTDEGLEGLAKGIGFRLIESLGVIPRAEVSGDVKALDQEGRALLRKHGVRFGQFTIFLPVLLKPAPTRLRLVLASLHAGLDDFPSAPPPGLVTVPAVAGAGADYYGQAGYRLSGERAIRIDMLERLADLIRGEDAKGGFEATPDMLSITGLTLDQFADLMKGMGYAAERGEREKQRPPKPVPDATADAPEAEASAAEQPAEASETPAEPAAEDPATAAADDAAAETAEAAQEATPEPTATDVPETAEPAEPEAEVFYIFTRQQRRPGGGRPDRARSGKNNARPPKKGGQKPKRGEKRDPGPRNYSARPPKSEKAIDPDNPFAALAALKEKG